MYSWGIAGVHGKLGHGDYEDRITARSLTHSILSQVTIVQVACGSDHSVLLGMMNGNVHMYI